MVEQSKELSDLTIIAGIHWVDLRELAMSPYYKETDHFVRISKSNQLTVIHFRILCQTKKKT